MWCVVAKEGSAQVAERPDPVPGSGELLVRVAAAGLNGADLSQVAGGYPAPPGSPPDVLGLELAGTVVGVGAGPTRFAVGARVMSLLGGGGQAELAVVHDRVAMPVPDSVDLHVAGGFAEAYTTAHDALFTQCGLGCGERVLVHGATGGVGSAAVQLAVAAGAQVTACLRATEHAAAIAAMGAQVVEPSGFVDAGPFDVVLETVGAASIPRDIDALAVGGRLAVIGTRATGTRSEVDFRQLMAKRARIFASTLRSRPLEERARAARLVERHALPLLAAGRLTVPVHAFRPLTGAPDAYAAFDRPGKLGKIILTVRPDREGVDDE